MLVYRLFCEVSLHSSGLVIDDISTVFMQNLVGLQKWKIQKRNSPEQLHLDVERQENKLLIKVGYNGQRKSLQTFRKKL